MIFSGNAKASIEVDDTIFSKYWCSKLQRFIVRSELNASKNSEMISVYTMLCTTFHLRFLVGEMLYETIKY